MKNAGFLVAAALAGCSFSSMSQIPAASPLSPNASSKTLVYVSDYSSVLVYAYETGTQVGKLDYFNHAAGSCTDAAGDVYVANDGDADVIEFSHGGTKPKYIVDPSPYPVDCAIDRTTGNLAVINQYGYSEYAPGIVAVYAAGKGKPKLYKSPFSTALVSGAYDARGNLLVSAYQGSTIAFATLPAGKTKMETVSLPLSRNWYGPAYVRWDGQYFVADFRTGYTDDPGIFVMYSIKGLSGERQGYALAEYSGSGPFWLGKIGGAKSLQRANQLLVCGQSGYGGLMYYDYPEGGAYIYDLYQYENCGVTVSP